MNPSTNVQARVTRVARRAALVTSGIVLSAAGAYVVIYLARWEWNRALVSASIFIAMLQVLSTAILAARLRTLATTARVVIINTGGEPIDTTEAAVGALLDGAADDTVAAALRQSNDDHASRAVAGSWRHQPMLIHPTTSFCARMWGLSEEKLASP